MASATLAVKAEISTDGKKMESAMLEYEYEHLKIVARRWREKRIQSKQSKMEFEKYARKTLLQYGWTEANVEQMMKIINKD